MSTIHALTNLIPIINSCNQEITSNSFLTKLQITPPSVSLSLWQVSCLRVMTLKRTLFFLMIIRIIRKQVTDILKLRIMRRLFLRLHKKKMKSDYLRSKRESKKTISGRWIRIMSLIQLPTKNKRLEKRKLLQFKTKIRNNIQPKISFKILKEVTWLILKNTFQKKRLNSTQ